MGSGYLGLLDVELLACAARNLTTSRWAWAYGSQIALDTTHRVEFEQISQPVPHYATVPWRKDIS